MEKPILLVDNNQSFLEVYARLLEQCGYRVLSASNLEAARELFADRHIYLVILDIRMENEDVEEFSGIALAREIVEKLVPTIILTAYPSYAYFRATLGLANDQPTPLIDFVDKAQCPPALLQAIPLAFDRLRINWDLQIAWEQPLSFVQLALLIEPTTPRHLLLDRAAQLEDLFRHLFFDRSQITCGRLFSYEAGFALLEVTAHRDSGVADQFVVACGSRLAIEYERRILELYSPRHLGLSQPTLIKTEYLSRFGATLFSVGEGDLEAILPFKDWYRLQPTETVLASLDYLYNETLMTWHRLKLGRESAERLPQQYMTWLNISLQPWEWSDRVAAICRATANLVQLNEACDQLHVHSSNQVTKSYPNPILGLQDLHVDVGPDVLCGISHGHVDPAAILVDHRVRTWLIDFRASGTGPLLRDFILLEMCIKLDLIPGTSIVARREFEERLLEATRLDQLLHTQGLSSEELKAIRSIERIRSKATALVGEELQHYLLGMFFCALYRIAAFDPQRHYTQHSLVPFVHALVLAGMLRQRLYGQSSDQAPSDPPSAGLLLEWCGEELLVWVEGRSIALTLQEERILLYLHERVGQLCTRKEILSALADQAIHLNLQEEESRLNTAIRRLRQKIEPNPQQLRYLITIRGKGYKLQVA